ncbi:MAG: response regulator [Thermoanaerobaculia bacterium]|nr:response regulator [Thermoanaerobaculia bacterium]
MNQVRTLRAVLVDDEAPARALLRELLGDVDGVEVVAECANGYEALKEVPGSTPDLLFLDVQMPKLDGFEVLELLGEGAPQVIFVTAYDEYALKAFDVHAVDYLLKPVEEDRLAAAVERARERRSAQVSVDGRVLRKEAQRDSPYLDRILVRDGSDIHVVAAEDLEYVEAQDDYVKLVAGDVVLRKLERLRVLEDSLDPGRFVRIHRSYLLNVDRLAKLELYAKDSRVAILRDGTKLPVSRSGYGRLRKLL